MAEIIYSIIFAVGLAFANLAASVVFIRHAMKSDKEKFFKIVYTSLVSRYFIVLAIFYCFIILFDFNKFVFSISFLVSCLITIFIEVLYLHFRSKYVTLQNSNDKVR
ncbi:MAG: hypothetical protein HW421_127 [Ignavibacteria bacterium]|nr:hypothetical protein [Ignavibacteria bacterium]